MHIVTPTTRITNKGRRLGKHRTRLEVKYALLEYLMNGHEKSIPLTKAMYIMFRNHKDTIEIVEDMERENLVYVVRNPIDIPNRRMSISITAKGLKAAKMIADLNRLLEKRPTKKRVNF